MKNTIKIISLAVAIAFTANSDAAITTNDPTKAFRSATQPDYPFKDRVTLGQPNQDAWGEIKKPYPTTAWFVNFTLRGGDDAHPDKTVGEQPIFPTPYTIKNAGNGLAFGVPAASFTTTDGDTHAQAFNFSPQLQFAVREPVEFKRSLADVSDLSVTLKYVVDGDQSLSFPIVRGAPYVTAFYKNLTPVITAGAGIQGIRVCGTDNLTPPSVNVSGTCFQIVLGLPEANTQTWLIYSEKPITLTWAQSDLGWQLSTQTPYDGWLRAALVQDTTTVNGKKRVDNDIATLSNFDNASTIPLSGDVTTQNDSITFAWKTNNGKAPLMMSLPHQRANFKDITASNKVAFRVTQGEMQVVEGKSTWTMNVLSPKVTFLELNDSQVTALPADRKQAIIAAIKDDSSTVNNTAQPDGPYGSGKRFARAARLALIADQFSREDNSLVATRNAILNELTKNLTPWVKGDNKFDVCTKVENNTCVEIKKVNNSLVYDTTWGGIIPSVDDYGSQVYNDHHFHYGYFVYTFAVLTELAKQNKDVSIWLNTPVTTIAGGSITPAEWIKVLIRDYANPNTNDTYFPYARHIDFFNGHSYASGLSAAADGRNQESISEAVNAYYGIALLGLAQGDRDLAQWGKLLLGQELDAAHTYWQINKDSDIYLPPFVNGKYTTGIHFDGKTDNHLWFSCQEKLPFARECGYGIQMMPFTAISSQLLEKPWVTDSYNDVTKYYNESVSTNPAWSLILLKARAMGAGSSSSDDIWKAAVESDSNKYDNGDSKTNTLYVIGAGAGK